jgi:hypothetical protein
MPTTTFRGVILSMVLIYPIAYYVPGNDKGSFERFWTAWEMITTSKFIQSLVIIYCCLIFAFNLSCMLVTFLLSSVWHAILDNFRPPAVWCVDLFLYYCTQTSVGHQFGEAWTNYSWLQLAGMAVLVYGTAIYNAPDSGSIKLQGEWYSLGLDYSEEYESIEAQKNFALGSYPSLQSFLNVATGTKNYSIRFGRRAHTFQGVGSPKIVVVRNYNSITDQSQHSI